MSNASSEAVNRRIQDERRAKYRGTASISLKSRSFPESVGSRGDSTNKSVTHLKSIFLEERGCRREDARHHAIVVITQDQLDAALETTTIPRVRIPSRSSFGMSPR